MLSEAPHGVSSSATLAKFIFTGGSVYGRGCVQNMPDEGLIRLNSCDLGALDEYSIMLHHAFHDGKEGYLHEEVDAESLGLDAKKAQL